MNRCYLCTVETDKLKPVLFTFLSENAMISNEMSKMLNTQVNAEIWSAYLYLSMSLHAESHGYRGISNWFYVQSREELDHSRIIEKYMMAQNVEIVLLPLAEVPSTWQSPLEMFRSALSHEQAITRKVGELMRHALLENDYATSGMLQWFVDEQVEEEEVCKDLVNEFEKASNAPCYFMQIDFDLQKRQYEPSLAKRKERWYS